MNSKLPFTIKPDSLDEIKKKAQDMRLEIAQRRAQRDAEIALRGGKIHTSPAPLLSKATSVDEVAQKPTPPLPIVASPKGVTPPPLLTQKIEAMKSLSVPAPKSLDEIELDFSDLTTDYQGILPNITPDSADEPAGDGLEIDFPLDFTAGDYALPKLDFGPATAKPAETPKATTSIIEVLTPSPRALAYAAKRGSNVRNLMKHDKDLPAHITEDAILESIAISQTQEQEWDTLKINQISIPMTEVSLWSSFFKIFTQLGAERYLNHPFEKGDTFELKIPGFHMFNITRIRSGEKDSLTFCVVQSKLNPSDATYVFEVLVKLPLRAGGILEIYRNRTHGPELINSWKIEKMYLKRPKNAHEYEMNGKKSGIMGILGLK